MIWTSVEVSFLKQKSVNPMSFKFTIRHLFNSSFIQELLKKFLKLQKIQHLAKCS